jgi:hypothetical protein
VLAFATSPVDVADSLVTIVSLPSGLPSEFYTLPAHLQAVLPVNSAGPWTFYLTARRTDPFRVPSIHNVRLTGTYHPRRY